MDRILSKVNSAKVVYYSGTGGTARVAECFEKVLKKKTYEVTLQPLNVGAVIDIEKYDLLVLVFAIHAFNAPAPVYNWIDSTEKVREIPAAVISVSGGGEVTPNTACRLSCIKKLEKKGYKIVYEEMFVMPSNWIVPTKEPLALKLLEVLPVRAEKAVACILSGIHKRSKPLFIDRLFSLLGELEKIGAKVFGKRIKVKENCNQCGWCVNNCPAGNITMKGSKPEFGTKCHLCLRCIYGCPSKALEPGFAKFLVISEGYNLEKLDKKLPLREQVDVEELAKGYLWSGVRKYLLEQDE